MEPVYNYPDYYDIAFSFRDSDQEVATLAALADAHARIPVRRVLEIACGQAPHLEALAARGYEYVGVDLSDTMLAHAREKAARLGASAEFVRADIADFRLSEPVDMAFVLLGSLYVPDTARLYSHFDSVARVVRPGGLYVLDWCIDFTPGADITDTWEESRDGIRVEVTYLSTSVDRAEQIYRESLTIEVNDHGKHVTLEESLLKRAIYPQEFLLFLERHCAFEFIGWWNSWDLNQPLHECRTISRPIAVIRRR